MNSPGKASVKEVVGGWGVFHGMMLFMRAERPKLKLDQIFGPDLIPRPKRSIIGSLFTIATLTVLGVIGYFYVTPRYLQWDLERQFLKTEGVEAAAQVAAGLVELGGDGTATVVRLLASDRPEHAQAAFQVLEARLGVVEKNEIVGDLWVKRVAAELKEQAGSWQPEARALGCELAKDIFTMFEELDQPAENGISNPLRWAPARLDCWAVLETQKVSENGQAELLKFASNGKRRLDSLSEGDSWNQQAPKGSDRLASASLTEASADEVAENYAGSPEQLSDLNELSRNSTTGAGVTEPRSASTGSSFLPGSAFSSGSSLTVVDNAGQSPAGKEGALVHIGPPQILEVVDAPMAHIEVVPRKGGLKAASRNPVLNSQTRAMLGSDSESEVAESVGASAAIDRTDAGKDQWQRQVQTIDARSPSQVLDFGKKQTLEVVSMLNDADPSVQGAAVRELEQRGFSSNEIDLASQLCRGSAQEQRQLLMNLPEMGLASVTPWYIWMAQADDRDVRKVAIEGLARVTDPQVGQFVRDLLANERDNELRELYRSILAQKGQ